MITTVIIIIIMVYLIVIGSLVFGFDHVTTFELRDLKSKTKFSVIIPFRNEAEHLPKLLDTLFQFNYPRNLFEVILVDDGSNDHSVKIIKEALDTHHLKQNSQIDIRIIENNRTSNAPKKDAIISAISISKFDWIITTDADCILPKYWLESFDEFIQAKNPNCIVAPVTYSAHHSFFNRFQTLDFLSLQGATIGGFGLQQPFLCNGANFGYRKSAFTAIDGFKGNTNIASGDDIFLLEKFKQLDSKKVAYLKSKKAVVTTYPVSSIQQLIQQRLRWASKTSHNPNWISKALGFVVLISNLASISLIPLLLLQFVNLKTIIALWVIKFGIDFLLLFKATRFFKQEALLVSYLSSSILYPFFSVYIVILSLFKSYTWKDRTFRQ